LGGLLGNFGASKLKHLRERFEFKALVLLSCAVQEGVESSFLEGRCKTLLEFISLEFRGTLKHNDGENVLNRSAPVRLVKGASSKHNMVTVVLSCKVKSISVVLFNKATEVAERSCFVHGELVSGNAWYFN
jgi:hypothetical protein